MKKPIIAINANFSKDEKYSQLNRDYSNAISRAGGIPIILPSLKTSEKDLRQIINHIDGLILSGGHDIWPRLYGEKVLNRTVIPLPEIKQSSDFKLFKLAFEKKIPILGICYGCQLINVALGGRLFQDIKSQLGTKIKHKNASHTIYICEGTLLHRIINRKKLEVNSRHHQSVKEPAKGLMINARSTDTIIEGVETIDRSRFCLGVQWHPETPPEPSPKDSFWRGPAGRASIAAKKEHLGLFRALVQASAK